jgi:DNA-binding CsgD family transcriptional regulator
MLCASNNLLAVIDAIGEPSFGAALLSLLRESYGADQCAVFLLTGNEPREIASSSFDGTDIAHRRANKYVQLNLWRRDPAMSEAWRNAIDAAPRLVKLNVRTLADRQLRTHIYRRVTERLLLFGPTAFGTVALSIVKSGAGTTLSKHAAENILQFAPTLLSLLGKHSMLVIRKRNLCGALSSLTEIEEIIAQSPEQLPRREAQVCARILFGISTIGMALDLGIGEETVTTYRKRVYLRLGIATQRELMGWYIGRWSELSSIAPSERFESTRGVALERRWATGS